jgi:hypothetical protein
LEPHGLSGKNLIYNMRTWMIAFFKMAICKIL